MCDFNTMPVKGKRREGEEIRERGSVINIGEERIEWNGKWRP